MNNRRDMWQQYEREWLRKQAIERRYEHIFKGNDAGHHALPICLLLCLFR